MSPTAVSIIMALIAVAIIAWDIWLYMDKRKGNAISSQMRKADKILPAFKYLVIFGMGLLVGHWWW